MDFNNHWDLLHDIMVMKEKAEYLDKVEKRAKNNFNKYVLKELEAGQRGRLADNFKIKIVMNKSDIKKSSCGRYYLKNIGLEEPNWVRLKKFAFDFKRCEKFVSYVREQYEDWECGGFYDNEDGVLGDIPREVSDFETFYEEWIALHGIHFKLVEGSRFSSWREEKVFYAKIFYLKNDAVAIKEDIVNTYNNKEGTEAMKQRDRFYHGANYGVRSLSSPFDFINKLENGALHYLKCRDYTWVNIEERKDYCDRNDIPCSDRELADSHYFIEGIKQPEEDPSWA